ncbi:MAG: hypothetical protein JEZ08_22990 [Clostridiales bacterium]|nr:hypothetical protein [Clostridiales bacterium]
MKTIIIYSTKHGFTKTVAEQLSKMVDDSVELFDTNEVTYDIISDAEKIIFGCPVYSGKLRREMVDLINKYKTDLIEKTIGMYVCSVNEFKTSNYLEQSLSKGIINHLSSVVYAGYGVDFDHMKLFEKVAIRTIIKKGDMDTGIKVEALKKLVKKLK